MTDDKKEGVTIYSMERNGLTSIKAQGVVEYSPMQIFKTIGEPENYRKVYDANYDFGSFLGKVGAQTFFVY
jgi:hypothetical protein